MPLQVHEWGGCQGELPYFGHASRDVRCVNEALTIVSEQLCLEVRWVVKNKSTYELPHVPHAAA